MGESDEILEGTAHEDDVLWRAVPDRIDMRVWVRPPDGCWIWKGSKTNSGYGSCSFGGRSLPAHRVIYRITRGKIPRRMHVCHHCDVRACVRPSHLFLGTDQDNMSDKVRKGRQTRGSQIATAKLVEHQIPAIRDAIRGGSTVASVARLYGVHPRTIRDIRDGKTWKHVAGGHT